MGYEDDMQYLPVIDIYGNTYGDGYSNSISSYGYTSLSQGFGLTNYISLIGGGGGGGGGASGNSAAPGVTGAVGYFTPSTHTLPKIVVAAATKSFSVKAKSSARDQMQIIYKDKLPGGDIPNFLQRAVNALVAKYGNPYGRTLTVITDIEHVDPGNRNLARPAFNFAHSEDRRSPSTTNNMLYIGPVGSERYDGSGTSPIQSITHELTHVFFPGEGDDIPDKKGIHKAEFYQHLYEVITALHEADPDYFDSLELSKHDFDKWQVAVGLKPYNASDYAPRRPIVLDLDGNGIALAPLTSSNTFFDTKGDGYQHRTAWAGAGDAVLAFDANNDGVINQKNEIVFTEWDPTAASDMQALLNVFDTNHNGKLDSGDQKFSQFKLVVTNANGTQTVQTLAQAGIASIDLKENNYNQTFIDGSSIDGQTIFTRTNGTTGVAATVTLVSEDAGHALQTTTTTDANGAVTVKNKALNPDGSLASETISVTSANGLSRTLSQDIDGDGVIDLIQTETTVVNANGSKVTTLIDKTGGGVNLDKIVTTTSADGKSITFQRDMDASGTFEQTETLVTAADGSKTNIISNVGDDGTLLTKISRATSANGLTRTDRFDANGDNVWDTTSTDATVVNANGSRTETVTVTNANSSLRAKTTIQTSVDGRNETIQFDLDGNGTTDLTSSEVITSNADGSYWTTTTNRNNNNSLRDQSKTLLSADNLSKTTYVDVNGDGFFEKSLTDVTVVAANGDRTETTTALNADGTKRAQTIVVKGADGRSRTTKADSNGDGVFDVVETITIAANGSSVDTVANYSPKNSVIAKNVVTTSADGLTSTSQFDADANGTWDTTTTDATVKNANGSSTQTTTVTNSNGSLRGKSVVSTSANGLSITTQADLDGNGAYDLTTTDVRTVAADNSHVQTVSANNANGSLRDKTVTTVTADRHTTTVNRDIDGNNVNDQTQTVQLQANGAVVDTVSNLQSDGSVKNQRTSTVSGNGLSSELAYSELVTHINWIWVGFWFPSTYASLDVVTTFTDATVLNADGSKVNTWTRYYGTTSGSVGEQIVTTISDDGLSISKQWTGSNGGTTIDQTSSDVTTYNADGSTTRIVMDQSPNGRGEPTLLDKAVISISASKLVTNYQLDVNGDGSFDTADILKIGVDGASVETMTTKNLDGSLREKEIVAVSADGLKANAVRDRNGDGAYDHFENSRQELSGATSHVVWETKTGGALTGRMVTLASANGLATAKALDTNGDGAVDSTQQITERLNADGSQTITYSDLNANGTLRGRVITTISANGLSKTSQINLNGLGNALETETDVTVLNADGSMTRTVTDLYADGSLKAKSVFTSSANGKSITANIDIDGDNVNDQTISSSEGADGVSITTVTFKDGSTATTTTSFDGLITTLTTSGGVTQTRSELGDGTGSYSWSSTDSQGYSLGSSSHTIDENSIDLYTYYEAATSSSGTLRIETSALDDYLAKAERLYDAAFDRDMLANEKEVIGKYINSSTNAFNVTQLANDLMNGTEFATRYGALTNLEFIEQASQNALNRSASIAEVTSYLKQLNAGTLTRADVMLAISESAEHADVGNIHATTNNSVQSMASLALDHTVDQQQAKDMVTRLYQTTFGRDPTSSELQSGAQQITSGSATEAQIAAGFVASGWVWTWWPYFGYSTPSLMEQVYGTLTNADFVTRLFQNSFGRNPTAAESADWVAMLDAGTVTRGDMIDALAESQDHLAYIGSQAGQAVTASNQTLNYAENAIVRITGGGNTINASSGDVLTVGGNGASGVTNTVNMSNGSASLRANSRMDVVGSKNVVTAAAGSTLGVNGDDNLVSAGGDAISLNGGAGNVVNGSGNTIAVAANLSANLVGDGNTINAQSGAKITISTNGQSGPGDVVNMSNGALTMTGGSKATINGSGNNVTLELGENLTLWGNNNKVLLGSGNDVVSDSGSSETFVFKASFGQDTLTGFDSTDHMQIDSAIFSDWAHLIGGAQQVGADTIITASPTDTITLKNVAVSSLSQGQFQFV
jgi:hypothetical protein